MQNARRVGPVATASNETEVQLLVEGVSKKFCRSLKRSLLYSVRDSAAEVAIARPCGKVSFGHWTK